MTSRAITSKLSSQLADDWSDHSYRPLFKAETTNSETERLVVGIPNSDVAVLKRLMNCIEPPFFLLYLLHTPRGEGEPGRYQSPELSRGEVDLFVKRFEGLLSNDARHDFWVHSTSNHATLVSERHNLIYAYGPLERFIVALRALGFESGPVDIPTPHQHHYRSEFDADAAQLLLALDWTRTPLRPGDEQFMP